MSSGLISATVTRVSHMSRLTRVLPTAIRTLPVRTAASSVTPAQLEITVDDLDLAKAKRIYDEYGCLVVRGLNRPYVRDIQECVHLIPSLTLCFTAKILTKIRTHLFIRHCDEAFQDSLKLLPQAEELKVGFVFD